MHFEGGSNFHLLTSRSMSWMAFRVRQSHWEEREAQIRYPFHFRVTKHLYFCSSKAWDFNLQQKEISTSRRIKVTQIIVSLLGHLEKNLEWLQEVLHLGVWGSFISEATSFSRASWEQGCFLEFPLTKWNVIKHPTHLTQFQPWVFTSEAKALAAHLGSDSASQTAANWTGSVLCCQPSTAVWHEQCACNHRALFSSSSAGWKSETEVSAGLISPEASVLGW